MFPDCLPKYEVISIWQIIGAAAVIAVSAIAAVAGTAVDAEILP